jgi:iron complex transport system substrate-binding protein
VTRALAALFARGLGRVDAANLCGALLALALAVWGGRLGSGRGVSEVGRPPVLGSRVAPERLPDGSLALRDAGGALLPLVPYRRIASASLIADHVLSELCEPTRIVAFSEGSAQNPLFGQRYAGKPPLGARASLESVLALQPDLLIVNNMVDPGYAARLREHGVRVFDLGHMHGLSTLLPNIVAIGYLIGASERAEHYARALSGRMQRLAAARPAGPRPRAMYVSAYADRLYGGALRTSYHDVLEAAGFLDVAAEAGLSGWPELSAEQLLALDPAVVVTRQGMSRILCRHAGLGGLAVCAGRGRVIELDGRLMDNPGPAMLEAAERLHEAYWGQPP